MKKKPTKPEPRWKRYTDSGERMRSIRVDDELWNAARRRADDAGITVSELIRLALREIVADPVLPPK